MVFPDPFSLVIQSVGDGVALRLQVACPDVACVCRPCTHHRKIPFGAVCHQERFVSSSYPDSLTGKDILSARIVVMGNVFDCSDVGPCLQGDVQVKDIMSRHRE